MSPFEIDNVNVGGNRKKLIYESVIEPFNPKMLIDQVI